MAIHSDGVTKCVVVSAAYEKHQTAKHTTRPSSVINSADRENQNYNHGVVAGIVIYYHRASTVLREKFKHFKAIKIIHLE